MVIGQDKNDVGLFIISAGGRVGTESEQETGSNERAFHGGTMSESPLPRKWR